MRRFLPTAVLLFAATLSALAGGDFVITRHGVRRSSPEIQTQKIQAVIDLAAQKAQTTSRRTCVVIPRGVFISGALDFRPGVDLRLEKGAVLQGSDDIIDFPIRETRIEGRTRMYFPALVNADRCDGFTISGEGTIDGNGEKYWKHFWIRRAFNPDCTNVDEMRPRMVYVSRSDGVRLEGVKICNSPYWHTHFYLCNDLILKNLTITAPHYPLHAPSTDAVDLDGCRDVLIEGCYMSVDDDAISLKGGKGPWADRDSTNAPNIGVTVQNCRFGYCQQALTLGSESVRDSAIVMRDCFVGGNTQRVLRLKMRPDTPQVYEDILVENISGRALTFLHIKPWTQFFDLADRPDIAKSYVRSVRIRNIGEMDLDRFCDVTLNPDEFEIEDITLDGEPVDFIKGGRYERKSLGVPFVPSLEDLDTSSLEAALRSSGSQGKIDRVNWPADYPLCPQCGFRIARSEKGVALLLEMDCSGEGSRFEAGNVSFDVLLCGEGKRFYDIVFSREDGGCRMGYGKNAVSRTSIPTERIKYSSLAKGNVWKVCAYIPYDLIKGGKPITAGTGANICCFCDCEGVEKFFLSWSPIGVSKPDFYRPDFFGNLAAQ